MFGLTVRKAAPAILVLCGTVFCVSASAQIDTQAAAQTEYRFQQMQDQIQTLTGQVETQSHQIEVLRSQLEKLRGDTDVRLNDLEGKGAPAQQGDDAENSAPADSNMPTPILSGANGAPGAPPRYLGQIPQDAIPPGPPPPAVAISPQAEYQAAYALIGQAKYAEAEKAFRGFVARYPKDPLAASASYWIGQSYFARNDFQNAAVAFGDSYQKYPKGAKAPDTLLDLGKSLARLNQVPAACASFSELDKKFGPAVSPAIKHQEQMEKTRLKCG
jgi:tol-pal system protein YbgF